MVGLVGVMVGPETAVPVGGKEYATAFGAAGQGVEGGYDVFATHLFAVPKHGGKVLHNDGVAPTAHLRRQIVGATALPRTARGAVAKGHLVGHIAVGAVGIEGGCLHCGVVNGSRGCRLAGVAMASGKKQDGEGKNEKGAFHGE